MQTTRLEWENEILSGLFTPVFPVFGVTRSAGSALGRVVTVGMVIPKVNSILCYGTRTTDGLRVFGNVDHSRTRGGAEARMDVHPPTSRRAWWAGYIIDSGSATWTHPHHSCQSWWCSHPCRDYTSRICSAYSDDAARRCGM